MDPLLKDAIQSLSWLVASIGGVVAAFKAIAEFRETRLWRRTELAKNIVDEIWADKKCRDAMVMVDWDNREFTLDSEEKVRINRIEVGPALRTDVQKLTFSKKEVFIRDCFDSLLDALQRLEHYIGTGLISFEDVEYPLDYTVVELCFIRAEINGYVVAYDFHNAARFLGRYDVWKRLDRVGRKPCIEQ